MNIPHQLYDHPVVREVIDDAYRRIEGWTITQHEACHEAKQLLTSGWDGVALMEILAEPLLELRGITADDVGLFETMVAKRNYLVEKGFRGALYEAWDHARKLESP